MSRARRLLAAACGAVAVALLLAVFGGWSRSVVAEASPSRADDFFANVPVSNSFATPAQVTGTLENSSNRVVPDAELVLLAEQPDSSSSTAEPLGELSKGYSDDSGAFSLTTPEPSTLQSYANPGGLITFIVPSPTTDALPYYFSRRLGQNGDGTWSLHAPGGVLDSNGTTGRAALHPVVANSDAPERGLVGGRDGTAPAMTGNGYDAVAAPSQAGKPDNSADAVPGGGCSRTGALKTWDGRIGIVGQWLSTMGTDATDADPAVTSKFTYTSGAQSAINVAVSPSGAFGSYKISSTKSKDSTLQQSFGTQKNDGGWYHRTYFSESKYGYACGPRSWYGVEPSAYDGGDDPNKVTNAPIPSGTTKCVPESADDTAVVASTTAITWDNGLSMASVIGIDVGIRTGYSTKAELTIHYNTAGRLCGRGSRPGDHPYVLAARRTT